ncbi:MAG: hypothetical protein Q4E28_00510 [Clostridia bacterium]|nr:hypothetical protein [Clostridia bacterium]
MKDKNLRKKWAYPLGIFVFIMAIVGIIFSLFFITKGIIKATDKSDITKKNYEKMILPLVMNDPSTFDDVSKADMQQLIDSSIWSILIEGIDTGKYKIVDNRIVLPATDVEKTFVSLYGDSVKPKHQTIAPGSYEFEYDSTAKAYKIPITGVDPIYTPKIIDVDKKKNSVILTVAYISGRDTIMDENGNFIEPPPSKYVKITLRKSPKSDSDFYISSLQDTDPSFSDSIVEEKKK